MNLTPETGVSLSAKDIESISLLGRLFKVAHFNEETVQKALGGGQWDSILRSELPAIMQRLPERGPLPLVVRLFLLGESVAPEVLASDLDPMTPERLASLGLVTWGSEGVVPRVRFEPFADLILASDPYIADYDDLPEDYVLGMNPTSLSVAALTIRRPAKYMLDVGTGFGLQAIYAARHCDLIVATDINPRALSFAAFNAALNGITNIEFRKGDLFDPVEGESFDLIVCNPPYVISPEKGPLFRDGHAPGDPLSRTIVQQFPKHLRDGGYASIRFSWALRAGECWSDPLKAWTDGSRCDALLLHAFTDTPFEYALSWNRPLLALGSDAIKNRMDEWIRYFGELNIQSLATEGFVLRRRNIGTPWVRAEQFTLQGGSESGRHLFRMFQAQDWLSAAPNLLSAVFVPTDDILVEQVSSFRDGSLNIHQIGLSCARGLKVRACIDIATMNVLTGCDGNLTLGQVLKRVTPSHRNNSGARSRIAANIARLHALGFTSRLSETDDS